MKLLILALITLSILGCAQSKPPNATDVALRLQAAGLPVTNIKSFSAADDPNRLLGRPDQYISKAGFEDKRLPKDSGFSVEVFRTTEDLRHWQAYLKKVGQLIPIFSEYNYASGRVLLRLSRSLTPEQAAEYERAFLAK